uniref:Glycosyltransferase n=1 Tax=viral metagenome TaxID=1070528 RepID=A0A6C0CYN6_9ZZZZ
MKEKQKDNKYLFIPNLRFLLRFVPFLIIIILFFVMMRSFIWNSIRPYDSTNNANSNTLIVKVEIPPELPSYEKKRTMTEIPKIVIQTWKTKTNIPDFLKKSRESIQTWMPDFQYLFFDDNDIETFMSQHYPHFLSKFHAFPFSIQRIDFFRYCAIHFYGGIYLDGDVIVDGPMSNLLSLCVLTKKTIVFPVEYNLSIDYAICERFIQDGRRPDFASCQKAPFGLGQFAFASTPHHPFWIYLMNRIPQYLPHPPESPPRLFGDKYYVEVYTSTGPDQVSLACHDYFTKEENELLLLTHQQPFRFGDFAQHKMQGSWK